MADPVEPDLVNHSPDEVCVLVQSPNGVEPGEIYDAVRSALNAGMRQALGSELRSDETLQQRFGGGPDVLHPLERPGLSSAGGTRPEVRRPWHSLASDDHSTHHFYYAIGSDRVDFHESFLDERTARLDGVRKLVNLFNQQQTPSSLRAVSDARWSIVGAAPNWLTVSAQIACGSPAGLPRAEARRGRWRFRFDDALEVALKEGPSNEQEGEVVVAILDTAPPDGSAIPAHGNAYLAEVLRVVKIHSAPGSSVALHADYFNTPPGVALYWDSLQPWWPDSAQVTDDVSIQDHGLFVAGIIHDIAPKAELHLIRVLNDAGIGDALGLNHVLSNLPSELGIGNGRRLIVNLSLGAAVPVPRQRHWQRWLPETYAGHDQPDEATHRLLEAAHSTLLSTVNWLHRQGVLVVAAAGNDALRPQTTHRGAPPPPRYPARYQEVFAVAAAGPTGAPASYSNRADIRPLGNGITSFGGEIGPDAQGVVGVYASETFPDGQPNSTGWAQWAGTSFSTPVIAGLAARLWQQKRQLEPADLMASLRGYATPMAQGPRPDADPDGPLDAPLLSARQEHQAAS